MADKFVGVDYFDTDALLTDEERMIRDTVRTFVDGKVLPVINQHHRDGTFPVDLIPQMAELGMLGASFQGYGCAGLNNVAYGLLLQELERGDSGIRSFVSVQGGLCMYPIYAYGSDEQKDKWLPPMAKGKVIGCFGLTEPDFGSNPSGMITRARKDGNEYVLSGTKMWITNGTLAQLAIIWAKTDDGVIRGFLVETDRKGFKAVDVTGKFSLRASATSELILSDVRIPASNLLPKVEGLKGPLGCLNSARYGIAWGAVGAAMACYDSAVSYSKHRVQFGRPIGGFQLVQNKLVWMLNEITKGQLLSLRLGRLKDEGKLRPQQVSLAKRNNVWMALESARMAREVLGANGICDDYPVIRHMLNLESVYTYEGTHDIHTLIIGRDITGQDAFGAVEPGQNGTGPEAAKVSAGTAAAAR